MYVTATRASRIADIVESCLHHCDMPFPTSAEQATNAARELSHTLQHPTPAAPFSQIGDATMAAIHQLSTVLTNNIDQIRKTATVQKAITTGCRPIPITSIPVLPLFNKRPNITEDDQGNIQILF